MTATRALPRRSVPNVSGYQVQLRHTFGIPGCVLVRLTTRWSVAVGKVARRCPQTWQSDAHWEDVEFIHSGSRIRSQPTDSIKHSISNLHTSAGFVRSSQRSSISTYYKLDPIALLYKSDLCSQADTTATPFSPHSYFGHHEAFHSRQC